MPTGSKGNPPAIGAGKKGDLPFLQGAVRDAQTIIEQTRETIAESHAVMKAADEAPHIRGETSLGKAARVVRAASKNAKTKSEIAHTDRAMAQADRNEAGDAKPAGEALAAPAHDGLANSRTVVGGDKREKRPKMTDTEQDAEFERVARDLGCDHDDEKFKGVLRKLAKPKASAKF